MLEVTPMPDAGTIKSKAQDAWKALTETEMEMNMKLTVTPLGLIAFAAGVGATICVIRCAHKLEMKRALKKQAKALKSAAKAKLEAEKEA